MLYCISNLELMYPLTCFRCSKSKIISRRSKLQIYKTLIRPVVTYGAETWMLTAAEENALRRFERKVLRKIYGPVVDKGVWRIRYNNELCKFMGGEDIVRFIQKHKEYSG